MNTSTQKKILISGKTSASKTLDTHLSGKDIPKHLTLTAVFLSAAALLIHPEISKNAANEALLFCAKTLIPSLFPFMIAGEILVLAGFPEICEKHFGKLFQKLFGINGKGTAAFVIGAFCGFPVGAKAAVSLYRSGKTEKIEAERLSGICNNCGIGFLISGIGAGLWGSVYFGIILYLSQLFSAVITGILLRNSKPKSNAMSDRADTSCSDVKTTPHVSNPSFDEKDFSVSRSVTDAVCSSVNSILKVIGLVVFFRIFLSLICSAAPSSDCGKISAALISAFTEITTGSQAVYSLSLLSPSVYGALSKILTFSLSAFGGLSVYMQFCAIAIPEGIGMGAYIKTKLIQAFFCTVCGVILVLSGTV